MAERLRQEETLQALEAAVGGVWEGGQDFDFSPQDSIDQTGDLSNPQNKNRPSKKYTRISLNLFAEFSAIAYSSYRASNSHKDILKFILNYNSIF